MEAAKQCVPFKKNQPKKPWITLPTLELIKSKHKLEHTAARDDYKAACKTAAKAVKKDWEAWLAKTVDVDLDVRDKRLGIKFLHKTFDPNLYEKADKNKKGSRF